MPDIQQFSSRHRIQVYIYIYSYPRNAYTRTHGVSDVRFVLALCAKPVAYY